MPVDADANCSRYLDRSIEGVLINVSRPRYQTHHFYVIEAEAHERASRFQSQKNDHTIQQTHNE